MGLFKRRAETKQELETLRAELALMRRRLDDTEGAKQRLVEHFGRLTSEHKRLISHVGDVENKVGTVEHQVVTVAGSIGPAIDHAVENAATTNDIEVVRAELVRLGELSAQVDQLSETVSTQRALPAPSNPDHLAALQQKLDQLAESLTRQQEQIADVALVATDAAERTDTALAEVRSASDVDDATPARDVDAEVRAQLGQLAEKVAAMDSRVHQVSLELTNQFTELSGDLDRASSPANATETTEMIEELTAQLDDVTNGQHRLANEQARYAIQFREDLAELADRLRRPNNL